LPERSNFLFDQAGKMFLDNSFGLGLNLFSVHRFGSRKLFVLISGVASTFRLPDSLPVDLGLELLLITFKPVAGLTVRSKVRRRKVYF